MHKIVKFLSLNICYVIYVLLWIKYWLMWFESLLVFILFKFKKRPNISGIRVVEPSLPTTFTRPHKKKMTKCIKKWWWGSTCMRKNYNNHQKYYTRLILIQLAGSSFCTIGYISRPCVPEPESKQLLNSNELKTGSNMFAWWCFPHNKSEKQNSYRKAISRFGKYCKRVFNRDTGLDNNDGRMAWGQCERDSRQLTELVWSDQSCVDICWSWFFICFICFYI